MRGIRICRAALAMTVLLCALTVTAQNPVGQIVGTVSDPSGLPLADAEVVVTNLATEQAFNTKTNATGDYLVRELPPGEYSVAGTAAGFKKIVHTPVTLQSFQNVRLDLQLELGAASENIVVTADTPQVDTRSSHLGMVVDNRLITEMPVQDRNIVTVIQYTPGVQNVSAGNGVNRNQQRLNIAGNRSFSTNMQYDGVPMYFAHRGQGINMPAPDSIQEVNVITSGVTAEYGRGTAVFQAVTKSGGNEFHGTAWEFARNDAFNSTPYFAKSKPLLREHDFGGTIGGPIIKKKLFFFASYQAIRTHQTVFSSQAFLPDSLQRQGLFAAPLKNGVVDATKAYKDARTGKVLPLVVQNGVNYYQIDPKRYDPISMKVLGLFPQAENTNGTSTISSPNPITGNGVIAKFDYLATAKDTLSFRWYWDYKRSTAAFPASPDQSLPGYAPSPSSQDPKSALATWTRTWSPSLLTTTRVSMTKWVYDEGTINTTSLADMGATNFMDPYHTTRPPSLEVPGFFNAEAFTIDQRNGSGYTFAQDWSWVHGAHEIKWGTLVERIGYKKPNSSTSNGQFVFDGSISGNAILDYLMGTYQALGQSAGSIAAGHYYPMGFYGQDTWKAARNLTLTLGLRWDIYTAWRENGGQEVTFVPGAQSTTFPGAPQGLLFQTDPDFPYHTAWKNLGPRVGFAWDVFGDGKTSLRGGYGISYDPLVAEPVLHGTAPYTFSNKIKPKIKDYTTYQTLGLSHPYLTNSEWTGTGTNAWANPYPYVVDPTHSTFKFPTGIEGLRGPFKTMYTQNVNLTLEHQLTESWAASASYVANFTRHGYGEYEANPAIAPAVNPNPSVDPLGTDCRRILSPATINGLPCSPSNLPPLGSLTSYAGMLNTSYNAFQAVVTKKPSHGLSVRAHYTWSRGIDQCSTEVIGSCVMQKPFNPAAERAVGDFDRTHNLVFTWIYEMPKLSFLPRGLRQVIGGWQLANNQYFRSGLPYTLTLAADNSMSGLKYDRPNLVGDPYANIPQIPGKTYAFNPDAFLAAPFGQFGDLGRNTMRAPFEQRWDASLKKVFYPLGEKYRFELRMDATNLLNHTIFAQPVAVIPVSSASSTFGQVTTTRTSGRTLRLGAHLQF